uniref:PKS/mFAS DH domain-containing protein n=1 Tax=Strigamia maritima TaxID=126957 RepID=T1ILK7_STRMM
MDLIVNATEENQIGILNNYITVVAIQVALVDTLRHVGIEPNGVVGHSVGELGCAYADGCFTGEQVVLAAYWRGRCVLDGDFPDGSLVAVGISWEEVEKRCPPGVVPACHNAKDNVTISGPAAAVGEFVAQLRADGIFTKEVKFSNIAFHSPIMNKVGPALHAALEKVIPNPKPRTPRWISTSIPEDNWQSPLAKHASAAYFVNNLTKSVLFQEGLAHVPKNAVVIEIAPHGLLQAILKQSIGSDATYLTLSKKNHPNNLQFFLTNIGKLYLAGSKVTLSTLYNPLTSPVPRGTPMIAPLVRWDHSSDWNVAKYNMFLNSASHTGTTFEIDVSSQDSKDYYLTEHTVDGRVLYPATGYLVLAWKALSDLHSSNFDHTAVEFEEVVFHQATILPSKGSVKLNVRILEFGCEFEISEGSTIAVTGRIKLADATKHELKDLLAETVKHEEETIKLKTEDIYKILRLRSYDYGPAFRGIVEANMSGTKGVLNWKGNWVTFWYTVLQFSVARNSIGHLLLPTKIQYLKINPKYHLEILGNKEHIQVTLDPVLNICVAGGIEVSGLKATVAQRRQDRLKPSLEEHHFIPCEDESCFESISPRYI